MTGIVVAKPHGYGYGYGRGFGAGLAPYGAIGYGAIGHGAIGYGAGYGAGYVPTTYAHAAPAVHHSVSVVKVRRIIHSINIE